MGGLHKEDALENFSGVLWSLWLKFYLCFLNNEADYNQNNSQS